MHIHLENYGMSFIDLSTKKDIKIYKIYLVNNNSYYVMTYCYRDQDNMLMEERFRFSKKDFDNYLRKIKLDKINLYDY